LYDFFKIFLLFFCCSGTDLLFSNFNKFVVCFCTLIVIYKYVVDSFNFLTFVILGVFIDSGFHWCSLFFIDSSWFKILNLKSLLLWSSKLVWLFVICDGYCIFQVVLQSVCWFVCLSIHVRCLLCVFYLAIHFVFHRTLRNVLLPMFKIVFCHWSVTYCSFNWVWFGRIIFLLG